MHFDTRTGTSLAWERNIPKTTCPGETERLTKLWSWTMYKCKKSGNTASPKTKLNHNISPVGSFK